MTDLTDEIRIVLHGLWLRRWLALGIAWAVCALGWLIVALIPSSYESVARVNVQPQMALASNVGILPSDQRRALDELQQTLVSTLNLAKVVRTTPLGDGLTDDAAVAARANALRTAITVTSPQDNVVEIRARQRDPQLAHDVVAGLIDVFRDNGLAGASGDSQQALNFLDRQLAERQKALQDADQKRVDFQSRNVNLLPGVGSPSNRLEADRAELAQVDQQLVAARAALAALNGQLAGTPQTLSTPGVGGGVSPLAQAQAELAADRARGWTDSHPDVIALKSQIAALRAQPQAAAGYSVPNPAYSSLLSMQSDRSATVQALEARRGQLAAEMAHLGAAQSAEPAVAAQQSQLDRNYQVLKDQYDKMLADREAMRVRAEAESAGGAVRFQVIDPPTTPHVPVAPNRPLLLFGVLVAGLIAGAGTAFTLGQVRGGYSVAAQLERVAGLPVLGTIAQVETPADRAERQRQLRLFYGGAGVLVGLFALILMAQLVHRGMGA